MKESLKCLLCKTALIGIQDLEKHFLNHGLSDIQRFPCHLCDLKFVKFSTLEKHCRLVHLKETLSQTRRTCNALKSLRQEAKLLVPESLRKNDELKEPEEDCQDFGVDSDTASVTIEDSCQQKPGIETQKKTYKCSVEGCNKIFHHLTSFIMHGRCVHSDERSFTCELCSKSFKTSSNLNVHIKMHKNQRDHPCNMCASSFFTSSHLKAHIKVHLNMTSYECDVENCGKTFIHLSSYKKHQNFHKGIKNYTCNVCERLFSQACHLRSHLKIHSNERSHVCNKCDKAFRRPDTLRIHQKTHEG